MSGRLSQIEQSTESSSGTSGRWVDGLTGEMPVLDGLACVIRQRLDTVLQFLPLAAHPVDIHVASVHKLRVGCRRLQAALEILATVAPAKPCLAFGRQTNRIRKACGRARDLDVRRKHLESLLPVSSLEETVVLELICLRLVRARQKVQRDLVRELPRLHQALVESGHDLLQELESSCDRGGAPPITLAQAGHQILAGKIDAVWQIADRDFAEAGPVPSHGLRIACKHVRYALEVFLPVLPRSFRDDFYPQLEKIQELLGDYHDAVVARAACGRLRKKWKRWRGTSRWERHGLTGYRWRELRPGLDAVLLTYTQQAEQARTEFLDLWPGFAGASFRQPVAELLTGRPPSQTPDSTGPASADAAVPVPQPAAGEEI